MTSRLKNKLSMVRPQVREAYRNGATLRQIGDVHGVSPGTVRNALIEMGEELRARGRRKRAEMADPRILPVEEVPAECGDGCDGCEICIRDGDNNEESQVPGYEGGLF